MQTTLCALLPGKSLEIRSLSLEQCTYMLAAYHLEINRIKHSDIGYVFDYLKDDRIYDTVEYTLLEAISGLVI